MSAVQDNPFDRNLDAFLGTRTPERKGSASASRTLVLVGNLPVLSGLWLSQFADREARERGAACMLRIDDDAVQIELFVANGRRPSIRPQATLADLPQAAYQDMLCVEAAVIAQPVVLLPGARWQGAQRLEAVAPAA